MRLKTLIFTVVVLAALVGAVVYLQQQKSSTQATDKDEWVGKPVLTNEAVADIAEIYVLANGQACVIQRQEDEWVVPDRYGLPVDFAHLRRFIQNFTDAKIVRKVTANPEVMERFELTSNQVTFKSKDGVVIKELAIGKTSESGDRFVQLGGDGPAYLMSFSGYIAGDPERWVKKDIPGIVPDTITEVVFELADGGQLVASRADAMAPFEIADVLSTETVDSTEVKNIVNEFAKMLATTVRPLDDPDAQAAKAHSRSITFRDAEGKAYTYSVGRSPAASTDGEDAASKSGPVFIFASGGDAAFEAALQRSLARASFAVAEHYYTRLPSKRSDLIASGEETATEATAVSTPIESSPGTGVQPNSNN